MLEEDYGLRRSRSAAARDWSLEEFLDLVKREEAHWRDGLPDDEHCDSISRNGNSLTNRGLGGYSWTDFVDASPRQLGLVVGTGAVE